MKAGWLEGKEIIVESTQSQHAAYYINVDHCTTSIAYSSMIIIVGHRWWQGYNNLSYTWFTPIIFQIGSWNVKVSRDYTELIIQ